MIKLGRYRHYKDKTKEYRVLGIAKYSETHEDVVIYEALYDNKLSKFWVRPLDVFTEQVEFEGKLVPRFEYLGE